jgi:hypothetical protein
MRGLLIWLGAAVVVIGATAGLLWWTTATAAQFQVEGDRLTVSGQLTLASTERLDRLLEEHEGLATLVLGDIAVESDATSLLQKGAVVRGAGLGTEVADGVTLTGDAVYLFLAGTERRLGDGAGLVATDWQSRVGPASLLPREHPAHEERRDYMRRMLGSEDFYWYMLEAGEGSGRPVTEAELAAFGILTAE